MLEEMLRAEAASAMEHCALSNRRISDIHSCGEKCGIKRECGIKIRAESMFGIGIRNSADVRNQSGAS
ncbi:hypothetical protein EVAR_103670_1 [Eumeta japonica]|uniref:Uncharacterized protein n=1 Tax=Eumeta variegata TaxID=151549 RepID=A0A4C1Z0F9_EUMVA|nr:hypothetical protein EVAR_103670_1 [Eumeta japonica]